MSALFGLLTACSDDSENTAEKSEIRLKSDVWKMMEGTRATTIDDNDDLQDCALRIDAYYNGTDTKYLNGSKLVYDTDHWRFDNGSGSETHYYWPIEGSVYDPSSTNITVSSLDFVGYCPYTAPGYITPEDYSHSTGASFTCDLSSLMTNTAQASMAEYLIAVLPNQTYATQVAASGALPLEFKHPFALVKFEIAAASGTHVQVNSISIGGLNTSATCTYNGSTMTWGSHSGSAAMTITQTLKLGGTTVSTPFIVIPNDYGSMTLTVNGTWDDWSAVTKDISTTVDIDWEPGYIYTYNLTVTKYALKVDIEKFTEQW